ncbi:MAG: T9SS type A sorting domain-containing protein [bacterium]|nr:T9SS type A sorting domain-containing protein [bacterium]
MKNKNLQTTLLLLGFAFLLANPLKAQKDTIPPTIIITQADTNCIQLGSVFILKDPIVSDNQSRTMDIMVTNTWEQPNGPLNSLIRGNYVAKFEAIDTNGNRAVRYVSFKVDDCIPPTIDLQTSDTVCVKWRTAYIRIQPKVSDNYYTNNQISLNLKMSDVNPNIIGYYTDVYEATDPSGNLTTKIRVVKVALECAPTAALNTLSSLQMTVFPNPAQTYIEVGLIDFNLIEPMLIRLIAVDGRVLYQSEMNSSIRIDSDGLANGLYTLALTGGGVILNKVIVVQH